MKKGLPVSPGFALAPAYCLDRALGLHQPKQLDPDALPEEIRRLERAWRAAGQELDELIDRVRQQVGQEEVAIFLAHRLLLHDPVLMGKVKSLIRSRQIDAHSALRITLEEYSAAFARIPDNYLKERAADLRDVVGRVLKQIDREQLEEHVSAQQPVVLLAEEILPSHAAMFDRLRVAGIVTETGAATGHAAILARAQGIPAVSGLPGILDEVQTGDLIAVDGRCGCVYIKPGAEIQAFYRTLQREFSHLHDQLIENRDQAPITADGVRIELLANVNGPLDASAAARLGAGGIGLYRTEYLFLNHTSLPNEEEQYAAYRAVLEAAPAHRAVIRTIDLGGDKHIPFLTDQREANPFLGWRSSRLISAHPEVFRTQLRAILRASVHGRVELLFPMISTLEEVLQLREMLREVQAGLRQSGAELPEALPVGVMLEVPAAALCVEALLGEVDFVSIGSNDLIQYVMAADRDNPKVAHLCEPFNPAVLHLLRHVLKACNARGKPVTLCGEMAGRPRCFLPLFGIGLRSLSMSPAFVPSIKELVRRSSLPKARGIAETVLQMKLAAEIREYLTQVTQEVWPEVQLLETEE
jgi:phosphoenolpyruvate-protein phosphotransferase